MQTRWHTTKLIKSQRNARPLKRLRPQKGSNPDHLVRSQVYAVDRERTGLSRSNSVNLLRP